MKLSFKLFAVYLCFTLGILVPTGIFVYFSAIEVIKQQIQTSLNEKAVHVFDKMDRVLFERYSDMETISSDPVFLNPQSTVADITKSLLAYRNLRKVYISLSYYDKNCIKIADTIGLSIGKKCTESNWTKEVFIENKISAASDIHYSIELRKRVIIFATPILDKDKNLIGAVAANISIGRLHQIIISSGEFDDTVLIDLIDHKEKGNLIYSNHRFTREDFTLKETETELLAKGGNTIHATADEPGFLDFPGNRWQLFLQYPYEKAFAPIVSIRNKAITIGSILILLSLVIVYFLSNRLIAPLVVLKVAADQLGKGNLATRVLVSSNDEIGQLSLTFNKMATDLNFSLTELERKNIELEQLDKLKDEFISNTSHELKTPLNGIIGIAESMIDGATGKLREGSLKNLRMISMSGRRLANLVNDLLDFSKLRNHELVIQKKPVDIKSLSEMVLLISKPLLNNKKIDLLNQISDSAPPVLGDENRLQQILLNLIGNAIKFTNTGEISISASVQNENELTIIVKDTGIGIPEDKFESIFKSFEQVDASISREVGGTGLGLSITKNLIELHGGKIWLESEIDKGSKFLFTIPISKEAVRNDQNLELNINRFIANSINSEEPIEKIPVDLVSEKIKILVVDDEPVNLQVLENHLSLAKYKVIKAQSGQDALEILKKEEVNLVLLDIMMPKLSGYDTCKIIRETHTSSNLPVIMLTAKNMISDLVYGFECGANDFLTKPFQKEELLSRIKTHIQISTLNKSYERFVPHEYLQFLSKESIIDVNLGDNVATDMSVIFSDIRSFATLSETMTPQENFNFVNAYFKRVSPKVREYGGIIVKYVGDAIMSVYKNEIENAIDSAIAQLKELDLYNETRIQKGYQPIKTGYGIHTGFMMLGMIGEAHRMQGDAFSDHVNLASRIEGLTKFYGASIIISSTVLGKIKDRTRYSIRYLDRVRVKGRKQAIEIYEVLNADTQIIHDKKMKHDGQLQKGINFYLAGDMSSASTVFQELSEIFPEDNVIQMYLDRSIEYLMTEIPIDWDGVYDMKSK